MGISIAKHRLEILKLAKIDKKKIQNRRSMIIRPVSWCKFAIKQTKTYLAKQIDTLVRHSCHRHHRDNSILSLVPGPKKHHSLRWKVAMLQRNNRLNTTLAKLYWPDSPRFVSDNNGIMMLTNGSPGGDESPSSGSTPSSGWAESEGNPESSNPWNSSLSRTTFRSCDGENWPSSAEEIKWGNMFKNLKPT
ncbi:hypothetical protein CASFOL_001256 [Castilleja foliolosa]|uniref:SAM domain-containing protein n=1 Tax=Castilleja foliolosa TaxID=1961234 RepID=A0ABD3EM33_9LAMI